jgi:hypothetical protein
MMASGKSAKNRRSAPPALVSRRQGLPWLTIGAVAVILALAAGIFLVVYNQNRSNEQAAAEVAAWTPTEENRDPSTAIPGIYVGAATVSEDGRFSYTDYAAALHVGTEERVAYNRFPPVGGPHDGVWAACNGVVYTVPVRDENMVHTLEHGAVWVTYNPDTIAAGDLDVLTSLVENQTYISLSPYPGLDSPISLQGWAHQLKVDSASDERVRQFIAAVRLNPYLYPETGATCSQPTFDTVNPPAFDASPRGADAVPMSGAGATEATGEMSAIDESTLPTTTDGVPVESGTDTGASQTPASGG